MTQKAFAIFMLIGVCLLAATVLFPAVMLVYKCFGAAPSVATAPMGLAATSSGGFAWSLFCKSAGLAALGATAAFVLAIPGIVLVGSSANASHFGFVASLIMAPLIIPPMVIALGVRAWVGGISEIRCILVWALWCWPIAALLVGGAWSRRGHQLYEVALLNGSKLGALRTVLTSVLIRPIAGGWLLLFALFLGDYSVPHGCDMIVYATALLSEATSSPYPVGTVIASLPLLIPMLVAIAVAYVVGTRGAADANDESAKTQSQVSIRIVALVFIIVALATLVPVYGLVKDIELGKAIALTWELYRADVAYSIVTALVAGVIIIWMGTCVAASATLRRVAPLLILAWAVIPGALIGEAVVAAYLPFDAVYSHWSLTVIGYVARFGWMGVLFAYVAVKQTDESTVGAAMVDGASPGLAVCRVTLANHWPTMCAGVLIAAAMSLAEVATTSLTRVPMFSPVSLILIEKFHRFEDDILAALCILLLVAAIPGIALLSLAGRWRR